MKHLVRHLVRGALGIGMVGLGVAFGIYLSKQMSGTGEVQETAGSADAMTS